MTEFWLELTPTEPLRVGEIKPTGQYLSTRSYVPGSVLRGALAEWFIAQGREARIVPVVQRVRFGNFFPTVSAGVLSLPFPMTALECKLKGGFREVPRERKKDAGHGIRDSLLIALAYTELERLGARFPVPMLLRCSDADGRTPCGGRMERVSGFYARLEEGWVKVSPSRGIQTKVALSRYRRAAQEGMLYHVLGLLPQGLCFVGRIWAEDGTVVAELEKAVRTIGIGALTTRGFGSARISEVEPVLPSLKERLQTFNERLRDVWRSLADLARQVGAEALHADHAKPSGTYFSVDLLAPALLRDRYGLPTLRLELELDGALLEPVWWATQPTFVGGWSTAWGLPKPTGLGAAQGSTYVFRSERSVEELVPLLGSLEGQGVGERTDEGLGEIIVCHPFHMEVMPV
jgi:CRISPR-associated protein Csx10